MNMAEVAAVAYRAGITDQTDLARCVAIAFAESGGNAKAHNKTAPDDSYGLWQINMYGNLGPARRQQFGITSNDALFDPATNAKAMMAISGGGKNWKPWSTYGGIPYLAFLPPAQGVAASVRGLAPAVDATEDAIDATAEPIREAAGGVVKVGAWVADRNNWFRVAKAGIGVVLIYGGLMAVAKGAVGKVAAPIVGAVAPVGKAAKAVGGMVK